MSQIKSDTQVKLIGIMYPWAMVFSVPTRSTVGSSFTHCTDTYRSCCYNQVPFSQTTVAKPNQVVGFQCFKTRMIQVVSVIIVRCLAGGIGRDDPILRLLEEVRWMLAKIALKASSHYPLFCSFPFQLTTAHSN
jgi:hypothetical protein